MKITNIAMLRSQLAKLLGYVQRGEIVEVQRRNETIAKLVPVKKHGPNRTKLGCGKDSVRFSGNIVEPGIPLSDWDMLK